MHSIARFHLIIAKGSTRCNWKHRATCYIYFSIKRAVRTRLRVYTRGWHAVWGGSAEYSCDGPLAISFATNAFRVLTAPESAFRSIHPSSLQSALNNRYSVWYRAGRQSIARSRLPMCTRVDARRPVLCNTSSSNFPGRIYWISTLFTFACDLFPVRSLRHLLHPCLSFLFASAFYAPLSLSVPFCSARKSERLIRECELRQ